jgi:hypothetical protein
MPIESKISRKRILLIIVIVAILLGTIIFFVYLLSGPPNWVSVASWTGQETEYTTTTEPFTINGSDWHINWQVAGYDSSSRLYVSVYNADTNELIAELPRDHQSGMSYFNTKGIFYLEIEAHGALHSWSVQVWQTP